MIIISNVLSVYFVSYEWEQNTHSVWALSTDYRLFFARPLAPSIYFVIYFCPAHGK